MPYIEVNMSSTLSEQGKETLKTTLGELITLIPGKTESGLMICINDSSTIYFAGERKEKVAYINIKLYKDSEFQNKNKFTEKIFEFFENEFDINNNSLYINFDTYDSWGFGGSLNNQ